MCPAHMAHAAQAPRTRTACCDDDDVCMPRPCPPPSIHPYQTSATKTEHPTHIICRRALFASPCASPHSVVVVVLCISYPPLAWGVRGQQQQASLPHRSLAARAWHAAVGPRRLNAALLVVVASWRARRRHRCSAASASSASPKSASSTRAFTASVFHASRAGQRKRTAAPSAG